MVVIENRGIVDCNEQNGVCTMFVHKAIFLRRKGTYVFRGDRFLEDPSQTVSKKRVETGIDPFLGVFCPGFYMGVVLSQSENSVLQGMVCAHKCSHTILIYA